MVFNKLNRVCNIKFYSISKHRQEFQYDIFIYNGNYIFCKLYNFVNSTLKSMKGTKFQLKVWKYLKTIPKGKVKTYKQVAVGISSPKSARAVANACAKNPYAPKIPCHRVIRSDGALGGYSGRGGIKQKLKLLRSEKVAI